MSIRNLVTSLLAVSMALGAVGCSNKKGDGRNTKVAVTKQKLQEMEAQVTAAKASEEKAKALQAEYEAKLKDLEGREVKVNENLAIIAAADQARAENEAVMARLEASIAANRAAEADLNEKILGLKNITTQESAALASLQAELAEARQTISTSEAKKAEIAEQKQMADDYIADSEKTLAAAREKLDADSKAVYAELAAQIKKSTEDMTAMAEAALKRQQALNAKEARLNDAIIVQQNLFKSMGRDQAFENVMNGEGTFNVQISVVGTADETVIREIRKVLQSANLKPGYKSVLNPSEEIIALRKQSQVRRTAWVGMDGRAGQQWTTPPDTSKVEPFKDLRIRDRILVNGAGTTIISALKAAEAYAKERNVKLLFVPQTVDSVIVRYTINIEMTEPVSATEIRKYRVTPLVLDDVRIANTSIGSVDLMAIGDEDLSSQIQRCSNKGTLGLQTCLESLQAKNLLSKTIDVTAIQFTDMKTLTTTNDYELRGYFAKFKPGSMPEDYNYVGKSGVLKDEVKNRHKVTVEKFIKMLIGLSSTQAKFEVFGNGQTPIAKDWTKQITNFLPFAANHNGKYGMISNISIESHTVFPIAAPHGYTPTFMMVDSDPFEYLGTNALTWAGSATSINYATDIVKLGVDPSTGSEVLGTVLTFASKVVASHTVLELKTQAAPNLTVDVKADHANPYGADSAAMFAAYKERNNKLANYYFDMAPIFYLLR